MLKLVGSDKSQKDTLYTCRLQNGDCCAQVKLSSVRMGLTILPRGPPACGLPEASVRLLRVIDRIDGVLA